MVRPGPRRAPATPGIPPQPARAGPHLHCAAGFRAQPPTRARARLLGPCFKTGRVGSRRRRGPRAPRRGRVRPGGAARSGRTERSPPPSTAAPGAGGPGRPRPARRRARGAEGAAAVLLPRPRDSATRPGPAALTPAARSRGRGPPARRRPSQPTRSRSRRTAAEEMRPTGAGARPGGGPRRDRPPRPPAPPPRGGTEGRRTRGSDGARAGRLHARRVESSGPTARTPPAYLLTVSRPLELSLQSSFQLSLTVLVGYRSRARI